MTLNDFFNLHYKQVDIVHKLWTYFSLVSIAAVTAATNSPSVNLVAFLGFGYFLFGLANGVLIRMGQMEAELSQAAIKASMANGGGGEQTLKPELEKIADGIKLTPPWLLMLANYTMAFFVLIAIFNIYIAKGGKLWAIFSRLA